jgi:tetratricopeptide (TPR) repeat protein
MIRLLCLSFLLSQLAVAAPPPAPFSNNLLDDLSVSIEKALNAWNLDEARLLMVQVDELNLHGLALLHYLRGRMALQQGFYERAYEEFVLAGQEDLPNTFLRLANAGRRFLKTAQRFESEHFVLFVPQGKQAALSGYALEVLEAQYEALKVDLGFSSREKLRVEMVASARELAELSGVPLEKLLNSDKVAFCVFGKIVLLSPSALRGGFAWKDSLARAYAHFAAVKKSHNQAPLWVQEALAAYMESRWRHPAPPPLPNAPWAALQQHMRTSNTLLFEKLRSPMAEHDNPHTARLAFAEGFLLVEHLRNQQGPEAFSRLLEKLSGHGDAKRAISELSATPWTRWKQTFRNAALSRRFPQSPKSPAQEKTISSPALLRELRLAKLYADNQRNQAAAHHYAKAWALGGQHLPSVAQSYVQVLLSLSRFDEAERVLAAGLTQETAPATVWISLGKLRLHQSQWAEAQKAFERALAQNPFFPELHLGLFAAAHAQGNTPLAKRAQDAAAVLLQTTPEAGVDMAKALSAP